jgi:putative transposase
VEKPLQHPAAAIAIAKRREGVLSHLAEQPECSRAMIKKACATLELSRAMVFRLLARYKEDRRFSVLLPRPQGRKRGSHALLEGQERMISLQIQKVARTGENPSLAALHRKIAAACRKRRLPIPSYGTVLRRLRAYDARISRRKLEHSTRSQSTVQRRTQSTR